MFDMKRATRRPYARPHPGGPAEPTDLIRSQLGSYRRQVRHRFHTKPATVSDENLLNLLLARSMLRRDVRPLGRRLLGEFGSLAGVLSASPGDLAEAGLTPHAVFDLSAIGEVSRRCRR